MKFSPVFLEKPESQKNGGGLLAVNLLLQIIQSYAVEHCELHLTLFQL